MYKRSLITLVMVFVAAFFGNPTTHPSALQLRQTLMLEINGDFWAWNGASTGLSRLTSWGYNSGAIISPDGKWAAYKSTAALAVDMIKSRGPMGGGDIAANLWILSVGTGDAIRIADQPANASFMQPGRADDYLVRSNPTWSPDSSKVAWTQLRVIGEGTPAATSELVVYDLAQQSAQIIVSTLPTNYGVTSALPVSWGETGIVVWSQTGSTDAAGKFTVEDSLLVFDQIGQQLSTIKIDGLYEFALVKDVGKEYIGILAKSPSSQQIQGTQWLLAEATTGRIFAMPGVPEMYSLLSPDGVGIFAASIGTAPDWQVTAPDGTLVKLGNVDDVYTFTQALSISGDGKQVAYVQQGGAYVFANGKAVKIAESDVSALGWGPIGWRVRRKLG
jgi:hypothetical protein